MQRVLLSFIPLLGLAAAAAGQAPKTVDPGMTQTQVVERIGQPDGTRSSGNFTYMFYKNGCVKTCGMDDIVILDSNSVVDAIFRSPERHYSGKSSSPHSIPADVAAKKRSTGRTGSIEIPGGTVTQSGSPQAAPEKSVEAPLPEKAAPAPEQAAPAKPTATKTAPGDSAAIRIPVKPQHNNAPRDSAAAKNIPKKPGVPIY
jgi:hypothetical protein